MHVTYAMYLSDICVCGLRRIWNCLNLYSVSRDLEMIKLICSDKCGDCGSTLHWSQWTEECLICATLKNSPVYVQSWNTNVNFETGRNGPKNYWLSDMSAQFKPIISEKKNLQTRLKGVCGSSSSQINHFQSQNLKLFVLSFVKCLFSCYIFVYSFTH